MNIYIKFSGDAASKQSWDYGAVSSNPTVQGSVPGTISHSVDIVKPFDTVSGTPLGEKDPYDLHEIFTKAASHFLEIRDRLVSVYHFKEVAVPLGANLEAPLFSISGSYRTSSFNPWSNTDPFQAYTNPQDPSEQESSDGVTRDCVLVLPSRLSHFYAPEFQTLWNVLFVDGATFPARHRLSLVDDPDTVFIDAIEPICDLFYLLQCVVPGMLIIACQDIIADDSEKLLPPRSWVEKNQAMLLDVLGSTVHGRLLEYLGEDAISRELHQARAFQYRDIVDDDDDDDGFEIDRDYDFNDDRWDRSDMYGRDSDDDYVVNRWGVREPKDYTACSLECGYCGACEY